LFLTVKLEATYPRTNDRTAYTNDSHSYRSCIVGMSKWTSEDLSTSYGPLYHITTDNE